MFRLVSAISSNCSASHLCRQKSMARLLLKVSFLLGVGVRYIDYHQTISNYIYINSGYTNYKTLLLD